MQKEQLPANTKKIDFVGLYLESDQLLTGLKNVLMDYKQGGLMAMKKVQELTEENEKLTEELEKVKKK